MSKRRFNPGDRVRHFIGGPVMEVQHYELKKQLFFNLFQQDEKVVCTWKAGNQRKKQVFDQNVLIKLGEKSSLNTGRDCQSGRYLDCREMN